MPLPSVFQGIQDCRLTGLKPSKRFRRPPRQQLLQLHALRSVFQGLQACRLPARKTSQTLRFVFQGVQACRLPARKTPKCSPAAPNLHAPAELLHLHAPAICFSGSSRLPFARPQTPQTLPQASKATTLTATCPCHLFFREFETAV